YLDLARSNRSFFVRWFLARLVGTIADVAYAFADRVVPVCQDSARWAIWRGVGAERIHVIYAGADPERFVPAAAGVPRPRRPLAASVDPLLPSKGPLDLVAASDLVRRAVPDVEVRCCGPAADAWYVEECRACIDRLGLGETVRLLDRSD